MSIRKITVTSPSVLTNDTLAGYNFYSSVDGKLNVSVVSPATANAGVDYDLTDGVSHNITAKPVGTTNGEFTAISSAIVVSDLTGVSAPFVMATNANTTFGAGVTFVAGTPNEFQATANNQYLKFNNEKTGAFAVKMAIRDTFTKNIAFGVDNVNDNVSPFSNWEAHALVSDTYAIKVGASSIDPNVPTTVAVGATNYVKLSRASAGASILLHYFNGTSEVLVHTFAAASGSTWIKAFITSSNRRIYDLQIQ